MEPLPYEVTEAMIQCFGRSFWYKDGVAAFMRSAGVATLLVEKHREEAKFVWARHVLTDLAGTEEGCVLQRKLLGALVQLTNLPDSNVPDRSSGLDALRNLKVVAQKHDLVIRRRRENASSRARVEDERVRIVQERAKKLKTIRDRFSRAVTNLDRHEAGYSLEDLLAELFLLFEIPYQISYRTPSTTQQIDGHFRFQGFDYLVEARWRKTTPTEAEIGGFKQKVDTKLVSTRGVFVSIVGFRTEVVRQFSGRGANIILMDGQHLMHVLEGRISLSDALEAMIENAAKKGIPYHPIW